jgi:hypothetical protein
MRGTAASDLARFVDAEAAAPERRPDAETAHRAPAYAHPRPAGAKGADVPSLVCRTTELVTSRGKDLSSRAPPPSGVAEPSRPRALACPPVP